MADNKDKELDARARAAFIGLLAVFGAAAAFDHGGLWVTGTVAAVVGVVALAAAFWPGKTW